MAEAFDFGNQPIDVVQIMKEIRESIQAKREQGIYTDEEVEELASVRLRSYADEADIDSELLERLLSPSHVWNIATDYAIRTHRRGPAARLIVLAKKAVRPVVRLYTDHILNRQAQLNQYFAHLLHNLVRETTRLQIELTGLRNRCDVLEREKDFLERRVKTFEGMAEYRPGTAGRPEAPAPPAPAGPAAGPEKPAR